jgi:hypothetical protein
MIRPVLGAALKITAIKDTHIAKNVLNIWPNPAKDYININPGELQLYGSAHISINDLNGRELINVPFNERVDISSLHDGMYFVIISINGIRVAYNRIIKSR